MTTLTLPGAIESALPHFALAGLAAILEENGPALPRFHWSEDLQQLPLLCTELSPEQVATAVRSHAQRHTTASSWLPRRALGGTRDGAGLFTARAKGPADDEWHSFAAQRSSARRSLPLTRLDERLLSALGEPAWWLTEVQGRSADDGASRWEMKTRNQGQEFILHRLWPLAEVVAARDDAAVLRGLTGGSVVDELGKDAPESRTGTGLTTPGPVDSAVAWCALWGLHVAPTVHRLASVSQSAGVWPRVGVHPRAAVLPVFTVPVSSRRFGEILGSKQFDTAAFRATSDADDGARLLEVEAARSWLAGQGVRALVRFPILKTGSSSAPERQVLNGEVSGL
jgi:CRISPR-associated protein Csb3